MYYHYLDAGRGQLDAMKFRIIDVFFRSGLNGAEMVRKPGTVYLFILLLSMLRQEISKLSPEFELDIQIRDVRSSRV